MSLNFDERLSDSPYVHRVWDCHSERVGSFISISSTRWEIVVSKYQGKTTLTVRGPETKPTPLDFPVGAEWFGIDFEIGTFMPQFPPGTLRDFRDVNLPEATSKSFWLHGSAWQFPNIENADTFVDRLVREGLLVRDPVVEAVRQGQPQDLSLRAVQYRFLQATGLTYKAIQQIERARQAATLLERGASILDTVHEAGYFDQPHLTRSLKRFLGLTPAQVSDTSQIITLSRAK
jgi:hypothetical protein